MPFSSPARAPRPPTCPKALLPLKSPPVPPRVLAPLEALTSDELPLEWAFAELLLGVAAILLCLRFACTRVSPLLYHVALPFTLMHNPYLMHLRRTHAARKQCHLHLRS